MKVQLRQSGGCQGFRHAVSVLSCTCSVIFSSVVSFCRAQTELVAFLMLRERAESILSTDGSGSSRRRIEPQVLAQILEHDRCAVRDLLEEALEAQRLALETLLKTSSVRLQRLLETDPHHAEHEAPETPIVHRFSHNTASGTDSTHSRDMVRFDIRLVQQLTSSMGFFFVLSHVSRLSFCMLDHGFFFSWSCKMRST